MPLLVKGNPSVTQTPYDKNCLMLIVWCIFLSVSSQNKAQQWVLILRCLLSIALNTLENNEPLVLQANKLKQHKFDSDTTRKLLSLRMSAIFTTPNTFFLIWFFVFEAWRTEEVGHSVGSTSPFTTLHLSVLVCKMGLIMMSSSMSHWGVK
jgi:hypothetical protein